ncbi:MAG: type II toxin-antitoxin system VapC family toxin [Chitinophagaceae bacterium]|nr:type II toxin-antitoxin system VapC family toxin [Chitinophagaceae bacterium]
MEQYLMDTNVVSDYFSASFSVAGMALMDTAIDAVPNISVITQIELLCWNTDEATTQNVQNFITDSVVLDISPEIIAQCVALRKGKKMKTPDAIIAATALAYGFTLITNNEKDFANISGLKMVNPHKL